MTTARWLILAAVLAPVPAAALDEAPCLSLSEVKGGHPRYHLVNGRQCWYAATSPIAKPNKKAAKPEAADPAAAPDSTTPAAAGDDIDVDPYGDPIWQQTASHNPQRKPRRPKPTAVGGPLFLDPASAYAR